MTPSLSQNTLPLSCGPLVRYFAGGPLCRVVRADQTRAWLVWTSASGYECHVTVSRAALEGRA